MSTDTADIEADLADRVKRLLAGAPPLELDHGFPFRMAQFDAGLAWVAFPKGLGGLGIASRYQDVVQQLLHSAGIEPSNMLNPIGYGNAAPVLVKHGTDYQRRRFLRPCFTAEEIWCQLMSEPGAGSDVAGLATLARRDESNREGGWILNGQKVWTSLAHTARWAFAVVRTDPDALKHAGITCFIVDMHSPGVVVRPLRMLNGKADFNEVFLDEVAVPDEHRIGEVGEGWQVVQSNLDGERMAFGAYGHEPEPGEDLLAWWLREGPDEPVVTDRVMSAVISCRAAQLTFERARRTQSETSHPAKVHAAALKVLNSETAQHALEVALDARGSVGTVCAPDSYEFERPERIELMRGDTAARYLRAQAFTIEAGTSTVLRNVLADAVLGLPREPRFDLGIPWRDIPRTPEEYERRARHP